MLASEGLAMALGNLWSHKLRSALTVLGVVIGVGSVVAVTALGAAFERSITSEFSDIDETSIFVFSTSTDRGQGPPDAGQFGRIFTQDDRAALAALPRVEAVIPFGSVRVTNIAVGGTILPFEELTATTSRSDFTREPGLYVAGSVFADDEAGAVVGADIARRLGGPPAVAPGQLLEVTFADGTTQDVPITGILAEQQLLFGTANGNVFVPLDVFYDERGRDPDGGQTTLYEGFTVVASDATSVHGVKQAVTAYFDGPSDARRLLLEGIRIDVQTADDIVEDIGRAFGRVTVFIVAIAAMSLLVGGIMIATIMLISVAERTREIGVMKAIGGLDRDVLSLFLMEAAVIGVIGSLLGVGAGLAGGYALVEGLFGDEGVRFVPPYDWIVIGVALGILTGIVAGFFPARRATRIQPVDALGHE